MLKTMRATTAAAIAATSAAAILLVGCSSTDSAANTSSGEQQAASQSSNSGGKTTCAAFNAQSDSEQKATVVQYLEDSGKSTSGMEVTTTKLSVELFCKTSGKSDGLVEDIETG